MTRAAGTCRHTAQIQWTKSRPVDGTPRRHVDSPPEYFCGWPFEDNLPPPLSRVSTMAEIRDGDCARCPHWQAAIDLAAIVPCAK